MKIFFTIAFISLLPLLTKAQWNGNVTLSGNAVCTATSDDYLQISITDGSNGSIIVFTSRNFDSATNISNSRIRAQRISSSGSLVWSLANNPKIISDTGDIYLTHAIPDGAGGAFIAFDKYTNNIGEVFVQHINNTGNISWAATGINVSNNTIRDDYLSRLCLDGSGGVIVSWSSEIRDNINNVTTYAQAFAQRINSSGATQWTAGGVQLSTATGFRALSDLVTDGVGGAIVFFVDTRNSQYLPGANIEFPNLDIYAQKISAAGNRAWTDDGVGVSTEQNIQNGQAYDYFSNAVSDGAGGAILVYSDNRNGNANPSDLYTQRINAAGVKLWTSAGVFVCVAAGEQYVSNIVSNGSNGIVALWQDERSSNVRLYAQQINSSGTPLWTTNGVLISGATDSLGNGGDIKPDGLGNFIASWKIPNKIKSQKINNAGTVQWATGGVDIYSIVNYYYSLGNSQVTISDNGKAIITWEEYRGIASKRDIYAKKLEVNGTLPLTLLSFDAVLQNNQVHTQWQTTNEVNVSHMNVQRNVDGTSFLSIGKVDANGIGNYNFIDATLPTNIKTIYYRLEIVDKSGDKQFSKVVAVQLTKNNMVVAVYPNPTTNGYIQLQTNFTGISTIQLFDANGKQQLLLNQNVQGTSTLDISKLPKGNYFLQITNGLERASKTIVVQ